jgi:hypothetical protein
MKKNGWRPAPVHRRRCNTDRAVNGELFASAGRLDRASLWLYGTSDPYYRMEHSRANFERYTLAGGMGTLRVYSRREPGLDGHGITYDPELWRADVLRT